MDFIIDNQKIIFAGKLDPLPADIFPAETLTTFLRAMKTFPLGQLSYVPCSTLDEITMFFDHRHNSFFLASVNDLLDLHAKHLENLWRSERKKKIRDLYWKHRMAREGA